LIALNGAMTMVVFATKKQGSITLKTALAY
jgi:hypothetical protein